jgi:dephospho-CoA kinase
LDKKVEQADYVIDNSGTRDETQAQVEKVWESLLLLTQAPKRDQ